MKFGIPEGSISALFLFNIYIDHPLNINRNVKYIIYADDSSLFF